MNRSRIVLLGLFFFAAFSGIIFRAFQLQLLPDSRVERLARRQLQRKVEIVGRRGLISDRHGKALAVSINSASLFAHPRMVDDLRGVAEALEPVLHTSSADIIARIKKNKEKKFLWLERQLDPDSMEALAKLDLAELKGIGMVREYRRSYPRGRLASHVLGFVNIDGEGIEGLERKLQSTLAAPKKTMLLSFDNLGRPAFSHREEIQFDLHQGEEVALTLDATLQYAAEEALSDGVQKANAEAGVAIVMNPHNGEILALANYPDYNPNFPGEAPASQRRNRSVTDPIEPGSVVKPFVVLAALESGLSEKTMIDAGNGQITIGRKTITESDMKNHRFQHLSLRDLIKFSSNVATVNLQRRIGFEKVAGVYSKLGWGESSGLDLPGESKGIFAMPTPKQELERATMSYGHGISVTPMQIAAAYAALANGGYRIQPHIIMNPETNLKRERVLNEKVTRKVANMMEAVMEEGGTGRRAKVPGVRVAGKTGTSLRVDYEKGGYQAGSYWSSFAGFLPAERPEYVIYVMVDNPATKWANTGGDVAAPIFSKIAQSALRSGRGISFSLSPEVARRIDGRSGPDSAPRGGPTVVPNLDQISRQSGGREQKALKVAKGSLALSRNEKLPQLVGLPVTQALKLLERSQVALSVSGQGRVVEEQLPAPGSDLTAGMDVRIKLR